MRARAESGVWPLVLFTVLTQAAAGACVALAVFRWAVRGRAAEDAIEALAAPVPGVALKLLVAGGVAAFFHMGRKRAGRYAMANLGASWLSREVLLTYAFGAAVVALVVLHGMDGASPAGRAVVGLAAALLGLAFVYAIGKVYRLRTVPAWDTAATPAAFFGSALLLGAVVLAVVFAFVEGEDDLADRSLRWVGLAAVILAALQLLALFLHMRALDRGEGAAKESAVVLHGRYRTALAARTLGTACGAMILFVATWRGRGSEQEIPVVVAGLLLLASELLDRFLFYASHRRVGL